MQIKNIIYLVGLVLILTHITEAQPVSKSYLGLNKVSPKPYSNTKILNKQKSLKELKYLPTLAILNNDKERITYKYDSKNRCISSTTEQFINGVWVNQTKLNYSYDVNDNIISELTEQWNDTVWQNLTRISCSYNQLNLIDTELVQNYSVNLWYNSVRFTHTYNNSGFELSYTKENWGTGGWVYAFQTEKEYDNRNNLLTYTQKYWDNGWALVSKLTYSYYSNDTLQSEKFETAVNGTLVNNQLTNYYYTPGGLKDSVILYSWINSAWVANLKTIYHFSPDALLTDFISYRNSSGTWVDDMRTLLAYNSNRKQISLITQTKQDTAWLNGQRTLYTYDIAGYKTEELFQIWLVDNWSNFMKTTLGYDSFHNQTDCAFFQWFLDAWQPDYASLEVSYNSGNNFNTYFAKVVQVTYQSVTDVAPELSNNPDFALSQNFPNPFNPSTVIQFSISKPEFVSLKVYDILGAEMATIVNSQLNSGSYSYLFNGERLSSGVYVYQLKAGDIVQTKKMNLLK